MHGNLVAIKVLHEYGASADVKDTDGMTPVHWACQNGNLYVLKYLVEEMNAYWVFRNKDKLFPSNLAEKNGHYIVFDYLFKFQWKKIKERRRARNIR
jgi:hypothetical protein